MIDMPEGRENHNHRALIHDADDQALGRWEDLGRGTTLKLESLLKGSAEKWGNACWAMIQSPDGKIWKAWLEAGKLIVAAEDELSWQTIEKTIPLQQAFRRGQQINLPASAPSRAAPCRPLGGSGRRSSTRRTSTDTAGSQRDRRGIQTQEASSLATSC